MYSCQSDVTAHKKYNKDEECIFTFHRLWSVYQTRTRKAEEQQKTTK